MIFGPCFLGCLRDIALFLNVDLDYVIYRWACTLYDRLFLQKSGNTRNWNHSQFSTSFFAVNHFLIYGSDACAVLSASHFSKQSSDWTWTWRTQKKNSLFNKNSCEFFSTEYIALATNSVVAGTMINMQIPHRSRGKEGSGRYLSVGLSLEPR